MTTIQGYNLLDRLSVGAASVVFKARQESTSQLVAVKILKQGNPLDGADHQHLVARFNRETQLCAQLTHPHIVRLLDKGVTQQEELFAVFEYVPGVTLSDFLLRKGTLVSTQAIELMSQVLDALVSTHEQGIVHRDLKPMNIMVSSSGARLYAKLLDFGIGAFTNAFGQIPFEQAQIADQLGTPRYSAPEQLRGEPPSAKSDLYAWGLILLECLTGVPVFRGSSLAQIYHQQLGPEDVPLPDCLLHHPLGDLLKRVLRKNPQERDIDARALYADFNQLNLEDINGLLQKTQRESTTGASAYNTTRIADGSNSERRQITMLCYSLDIVAFDNNIVDIQILDDILAEQLTQCQAICLAYSGYPAGIMGNTRMLFFSYPLASDKAALQAARAAFGLVDLMDRRNTALTQQRIRLQIRLALHTGFVVIRPVQVPNGLACTVPLRLAQQAEPATILVSKAIENVLQRHFIFETASLQYLTEDLQLKSSSVLLSECAAKISDTHQLLGRDAEFGMLQQLWYGAKRGKGKAVILMGEPGIGKTHLVQHLDDYVRNDMGCVWQLQCHVEHRNSALYPFLHWLGDQFQMLNQSKQTEVGEYIKEYLQRLDFNVVDVFPILCSWLSLPIPKDLPPIPHAPSRQRQIMLETLGSLLHKFANGPAILILEDVHWIDPTSRKLIDYLSSADGFQDLSVILTARPVCDYWPQIESMELAPLADTEAKVLMQLLEGTQLLSDNDREQVITHAAGNPLYLTELARARINLRQQSARDSDISGMVVEVPASLRDVLSQMLDRLGNAKDTAQLAAALGYEFNQDMLLKTALRNRTAVLGPVHSS